MRVESLPLFGEVPLAGHASLEGLDVMVAALRDRVCAEEKMMVTMVVVVRATMADDDENTTSQCTSTLETSTKEQSQQRTGQCHHLCHLLSRDLVSALLAHSPCQPEA